MSPQRRARLPPTRRRKGLTSGAARLVIPQLKHAQTWQARTGDTLVETFTPSLTYAYSIIFVD